MKNNSKFLLSAAALSVLCATGATAAERQFLRAQNATLMAKAGAQQSLVASKPGQFVGLGANETLAVRKAYSDADGSSTIRYQQFYKGIPVVGDDVVIARKADGSFKRAHGAFLANIAEDVKDVTPKMSKSAALRRAKLANAPMGFGVMADERDLFMGPGQKPRVRFTRPTLSYENEKSQLVIWQNNKTGKATLAYEVSYFQNGKTPSRPHFFIDAKTGQILDKYDNLQTALVGTGPGGNQKTGQYEYGTDFGFMDVSQSGSTCTMNNANVKSVNLNHGTSGTTAYSYSCPRNTFQTINGAYSPINDAHYFGGVVVDMYNAWAGVSPLTFQLVMRVHYSSNYENAFWNGSTMNFGDGANTFYPLTSLDVASHEVSHGYTEQNSNLTYSGKSGGLNEAFSDMAGEAAENYSRGSNDWQVGAEIFKGSGALRYMNNPPQDGSSIDNQASYYSGLDVHYSSGVYNKAFYNLATTAGWNIQKAFAVYARANRIYWTANVNWDQAGNGVMDAACDLGYDVTDVQNSLAAVGVTSDVSAGSSCSTGGGGGGGGGGTNVLTNGVPVTGLSASTGSDVVYTMDVPAGATNISFSISGGTGDADLYVKFGSTPTDSSYDCRPYKNGNSETCTATQTGGTYYVRVKAYSSFSGVTLTGSYTEGGGGGGGATPIDQTVSNISVARRAWKHYTLDLGTGYADLNVSISGGSGDADLYVRKGAQSTTSKYDCRPYKNGNNESCSFTNPGADTWYIDIRGYSAASGVTLHVTATPQ